MAKESVPNRRYTDEFKLEALRVAESVGINQTPKRLAMPIRVWGTGRGRSEAESLPRAASGSLKGLPAELEAENNRCVVSWPIPNWIWRLQEKAAASFAKEPR